jgi:hypothetical protein
MNIADKARRREARRSRTRFRVLHERVDDAARQLGLTMPVRVFVRGYRHYTGRYIGLHDGVHHIGVSSYLPARLASRALWHELTHAAQVEQLGGEAAFTTRWWAEMAAAGLTRRQASRGEGRAYDRTPLEREARVNERRPPPAAARGAAPAAAGDLSASALGRAVVTRSGASGGRARADSARGGIEPVRGRSRAP